MPELLARAQARRRQADRFASRVCQVGDLSVDDTARTVRWAGVEVGLTRTEYDLLAVLCRHHGLVLSKRQLLAGVWGFEGFDENLVEVHLSALRRKLEVHGPRLIHTVRGVGYILRA